MRGMLRRFGYACYAAGRSAVRAIGLAPWARRVLGRWAGLTMGWLANSDRQPALVQGHRMVLAPPGAYASPDLLADRYEPGTTRLFQEIIRPGDTVIDVGAHAGYYTLLAARAAGPSGKVYAFEPAPHNQALLRHNVALNGYTTVTVVPRAVSDTVGQQTLFLSGLDNGFHSLYPVGPRGNGPEHQVRVDTTTLDAFMDELGWPSVGLLKLDIEGGEPAALRGMRRLLARASGLRLVVEFCPWILRSTGTLPTVFLELLRDAGLETHVIEDRRCVPLSELDVNALIVELLEREGYVNLLALAAGAELVGGAARVQRGALDLS